MSDFDPFAPAFVADPFGVYAAMRASPEAWRSERLDGVMITRYDDALAVLRSPEQWSSDDRRAQRPRLRRSHNPPGRNIVSSDPPQHTRLRRILGAQFGKRASERWRARITEIANELLDQRMTAASQLDVIADLALPLPLRFTGELLGLPASDLTQLRAWSEDEIAALAAGTPDSELARLTESSSQLHAYFRDAIAAQRARGSSSHADLLSLLLSDPQERLDDEELIAFLTLMLRAATHTTTNLIGNGMLALLQHPAELTRLCAQPALFPQAIEELLRFAGPVQSVFRIAVARARLHGMTIEPGERVHVVLAAANRDERRFDAPDVLQLERSAAGQLGFGFGIHACLGAHVARLEVEAALACLLARIPDPVLLVPSPFLRWRRVWSLRELAALPIGPRQAP